MDPAENSGLQCAPRKPWTLSALLCLLFGIVTVHAAPISPPTRVFVWGNNDYGQTNGPSDLNDGVAIGAGGSHVVVVRSNGTVKSWGYTSSSVTNPPASLSNVIAVAGGYYHTLALRSNGTVASWGYNFYGETNVPAGLSNVVAIGAASYYSLAARSDGSLIGWGDPYFSATNPPTGLGPIKAVDVGIYYAMALRSNGTVVAWGDGYYGETNVPSGLTNVVAIAAGDYHAVALRSNGTVVAWGANWDGQTNVPSGLTNVVAIAAGSYFSVALRSNGSLVSWGYGYNGETNVPAGLTNIAAIAAGDDFVVTLAPVIPLVVSSLHGYPVPGTGTTYFTRNENVTCSAPVHTQGGTQHVCSGWIGSGSVPSQGTASSVSFALATNSSITWLWATNYWLNVTPSGGGTLDSDIGWIPDGETVPITAIPDPGYSFVTWQGDTNRCEIEGLRITAPMTIDRSITALFTGQRIDAAPQALTFTGQIYSAIADQTFSITNPGPAAVSFRVESDTFWLSVPIDNGTLNAGKATNLTVRVATRGLAAQTHGGNLTLICQLATNAPITIPVNLSLSHVPLPSKLLSWGDNSYNQTNVPSNLTNSMSASAGTYHSLALTASGRIPVWGIDYYGVSNVAATITDAIAVASGAYHALAIHSNGTLAAWGNNGSGQATIPPGLSNVVAVAAGTEYSMALRTDGQVVAWGINTYGQTNVPPTVTSVVAIAAGEQHAMALRADGRVIAWGYGNYGQTNVPVGLSNVVAIAAGRYHSLALRANGSIVGWGYNGYGQTNQPTAFTNAVAIAAGAYDSMALSANGIVTVWGYSSSGQTNIPVGLTNVVEINANGYLAFALTPSCTLTVNSPYRSPTPPTGTNWLIRNSRQLCTAPTVTDGGTQYVCRGWTGTISVPSSGSSNSISFNLTNDSAISWLWRTNFLLTTTTSGGGTVNNTGGWYADGSSVGMGATPLSGHAFLGWTGDTNGCIVNGTGITAPMTAARSIRAQFTGVAMSIQPTAFAFTGQTYSAIASQTLTISNSGSMTMSYSISPDLFWLGASSPSGTLAAGQAAALSVRVATRGLPAGTYSATLTVSSQVATNSPVQIPVVMRLGSVRTPTYLAGWGYGYYGQTNVPAALSNATGVAIAAGQYHSLAIRSDGTVAAWGYYYGGQTNIPAGLSNVVAIAAGRYHSLAATVNGTMAAWGEGYDGQTNIPSGLTNIFAVAGGAYHSVALSLDGRVTAWGYNGYGQTNVPAGLSNVVAIAAGNYHTMALRSNGAVVAWGYPYSNLTNPPTGLTNVMAIAAGAYHALALRSNGTVAAWGENSYGQTNVPAGLTGVVAIAAGYYDSMAMRSDGRLFVWGDSSYGQTNVPTELTNAVAIALGGYHVLALGPAVSLTVNTPYGNPVPGTGTNWALQGSARSCSVTSTVTVGTTQYLCAGWVGTGNVPINGTSNRVTVSMNTNSSIGWQWSTNFWLDLTVTGQGALNVTDSWKSADSDVVLRADPVPTQAFIGWFGHTNGCNIDGDTLIAPMTQARRIEARFTMPVITLSSSNLFITGSVYRAVAGQAITVSNSGSGPFDYTLTSDMFWLGTSNTTAQLEAGSATTHVIQASSRGLHPRAYIGRVTVSAPLASNTPQRVTVNLILSRIPHPAVAIGWGDNGQGQIDIPSNLTNVISIAGGQGHSMALSSNGTVEAWGDDTYGQATPPSGLSNIVAIASGGYHSLALRSNGTLSAWGWNSFNQTSLPAGLSNVVEIGAGGFYSMAIRATGTVTAWGYSDLSQSSVPTDLSNVVGIASGWYHSLALRSNGTIAVWGYNNYGQLDTPPTITSAVAIAAGGYHSLALQPDGTVVAWGDNSYGQLNVPTGLTDVWAIAAGRYHSMARCSDGTVVTWGRTDEGQTLVPDHLSDVLDIAAGSYHSLAITPMRKLSIESDHGPVSPDSGQYWLLPNSDQTLAAPDHVVNGMTQYVCSGWTGTGALPSSGTSNGISFSISTDSEIRWNWQTNYWLELIGTHGTLSTDSRWLLAGTETVVTASNLPGYRFAGWFGDTNGCNADALSITIPMGTPRSIEARFAVPMGNVSTTQLTFRGLVYGALEPQEVIVNNTGTTPLHFTIESDMYWLTIHPNSGDLGAGQSTGFTVNVESRGLPPRTYPGHLTIIDPLATNTPMAVSVTMELLPPDPPNRVIGWGDNAYKQTNSPAGLSNAITIAAGAYHNIAVRSDGTVLAWGRNDGGQTNCPPGLTHVVSVAAGWTHSLALNDTGNVVPWGDNSDGQTNIPPSLSNVVAIAAGRHYSVALCRNGTVIAWGRSKEGEINVPPDLTNAVAISAGRYHALALRANGRIAAWGLNDEGQVTIPEGVTQALSIAAGGNHSLALRPDGTVAAWGRNNEGQVTVPDSLSNVVAIAAGMNHSMALCADGRVWAWGDRSAGRTNVPPDLSRVFFISAGRDHSLALYTRATSPSNTIPDSWLLSHGITNTAEAVRSLDTDGDGMTTWEEYIADKDPTNPLSFFRIDTVSNSYPATVLIQSSTGRLYSLQTRSSLFTGVWSLVQGESNIAGNGGVLSLTHTNPPPASHYYRVKVATP